MMLEVGSRMRADHYQVSAHLQPSVPGAPGAKQQVFVRVSFDFDYLGEDGKRIFMREGEVLLLINKTNKDWWQVIRRGDRRPFYAPAKYVREIRQHDEDVDAANRRGPPSSEVRMRHKMSTFGAPGNEGSNRLSFGGHQVPNVPVGGPMEQVFSNAKFQERYRSNSLDSILVSDLNKAASAGHSHPPSKNNTNNKNGRNPLLNRNSAVEMRFQQQPQQHLPNFGSQPGGGKSENAKSQQKQFGNSLEKRPTFEGGLDKRKSWSVVDTSAAPAGKTPAGPMSASATSAGAFGPGQLRNARGQTLREVQQQVQQQSTNNKAVLALNSKGRISAYQNTQALFGQQARKNSSNSNAVPGSSATLDSTERRRKPVPLPRSKVPSANPSSKEQVRKESVPNQEPTTPKKAGNSLHARFFSKRSKTDLGSDNIAAYRRSRQQVHLTTGASLMQAGVQQRPTQSVKYPAPKVPAFNRPVPQKRSEVAAVERRISLASAKKQQQQQQQQQQQHPLTLPEEDEAEEPPSVVEARLKPQTSVEGTRPKPEVKEKPQFSTFKTPQKSSQNNQVEKSNSRVENKRLSADFKIMSKTVSEGDLMHRLRVEGALPQDDKNRVVEIVSTVEPVSITVNSDTSSQNGDAAEDAVKKDAATAASKIVHHSSKEEGKLVIDTSKDFDPKEPASDVAEPPGPFADRSEPLTITTQPLADSDRGRNVSGSASENSSFNSTDEDGDAGKDVSSSDQRSPPPTSPGALSTVSRSPPSPEPQGLKPIRKHVLPDWDEYSDGGGRKFYFNRATREKSWKPPRRPKHDESGSNNENNTSDSDLDPATPAANVKNVGDEDLVVEEKKEDDIEVEVPDGYEVRTDPGGRHYVNMFTGVRWFAARDAANGGQVYFYEENGNESCWRLPSVGQSIQDNSNNTTSSTTSLTSSFSRSERVKRPLTGSTKRIADNYLSVKEEDEESHSKTAGRKRSLPVSTPNFRIGGVSIVVVKQGPLHRTKLVENGRRHRKNWSSSHAVLTDTFLLFFKDQKSFASLQKNLSGSKPEHCVDLNGSRVEWCCAAERKSKRSNVFEVTNDVLGMTMLLQDDSLQVSAEWFQEIREVIEALARSGSHHHQHHTHPPPLARLTARDPHEIDEDQPPTLFERRAAASDALGQVSASSTLQHSQHHHSAKVSRTKSLKMKILGGGGGSGDDEGESAAQNAGHHQDGAAAAAAAPQSAPIHGASQPHDWPASAPSQPKSNIREKLRKFFLRRPTMDDLFRRGIIRNEPVFGSTLKDLHQAESTANGSNFYVIDTWAPAFVRRCIGEIEKDPERMRADGVYRQSGNLSHVQRIRLQVDQGNWSALEAVEDVHVLTGALKLFFRELKEPLIPWECVAPLLSAASDQSLSRKQRGKRLREIVCGDKFPSVPPLHRATLAMLLRHLLRVTAEKEHNRMQIPNLSIVFGPTLMWPPPNAAQQQQHNLALDMMQQNIIVEALLSNVDAIFGAGEHP